MISEKTKQLWEISKEREDNYIEMMEEDSRFSNVDINNLKDILTMIRTAEYRRGKEEEVDNYVDKKEIKEFLIRIDGMLTKGMFPFDTIAKKIKELDNLGDKNGK